MEQDIPPNNVIVDWLADYTHFLCDQFGVPHDQANGLLQQYLNLTARPQQRASSPFEQPTNYPEPPDPLYETHFREQSPHSHFGANLRNLPLPTAASGSHHEAHVGYQADRSSESIALAALMAMPQGQSSPHDQQLSNMMTSDSSSTQTRDPSPGPSQPRNGTPIGSLSEYDPLWVQNNNVDPATVENFSSAMKFDTLFTHKVIKIGDVLIFQVLLCANGQAKETEAHLKLIGASRVPGRSKMPDFSTTLLSDPSAQYPVAKACKGTNDLAEHLAKSNITVLRKQWRDIQVFRGQQALGSVWWVKQAFHLWRDQKDQEARETGQFFRERRARGKGIPNGVVAHRGTFGVWQNGAFVPDPNQDRYRPAG